MTGVHGKMADIELLAIFEQMIEFAPSLTNVSFALKIFLNVFRTTLMCSPITILPLAVSLR